MQGLLPIRHRTEERVTAHILVQSLALTLDQMLDRKLRKAGLKLSTQAPEWMNAVEFDVTGQVPHREECVNGEEALTVLGVRLEVPQPPAKGELTVHKGPAMKVQKVGTRPRLRISTLYVLQVASPSVEQGLEVNPAFAQRPKNCHGSEVAVPVEKQRVMSYCNLGNAAIDRAAYRLVGTS